MAMRNIKFHFTEVIWIKFCHKFRKWAQKVKRPKTGGLDATTTTMCSTRAAGKLYFGRSIGSWKRRQ
jgi:hypothetical protein